MNLYLRPGLALLCVDRRVNLAIAVDVRGARSLLLGGGLLLVAGHVRTDYAARVQAREDRAPLRKGATAGHSWKGAAKAPSLLVAQRCRKPRRPALGA